MSTPDPLDDRVPFCGMLGRGWTAGHEQGIRTRHIGERRVNAQVHQVAMVVDHARVLGANDHL